MPRPTTPNGGQARQAGAERDGRRRFSGRCQGQGNTDPDARCPASRDNIPTGTYFADWAIPQARALTESGYADVRITTTLDARLQNIARSVIARAPLGKAQVAMVAMRPNGEVVAMVGGRSYKILAVQPRDAGEAPAGIDLQDCSSISLRCGRG